VGKARSSSTSTRQRAEKKRTRKNERKGKGHALTKEDDCISSTKAFVQPKEIIEVRIDRE